MFSHRNQVQDVLPYRSLLHACFGWNEHTWSQPFQKLLESGSLKLNGSVLEIGAGEWSSLAPFFVSKNASTTCTYYLPEQFPAIEKRNQRLINDFNIDGSIDYKLMDALNVDGKYDLIVLKSVLGGIFKHGSSTETDADEYLQRVARQNLLPGGHVVTLDNGVSLIEPIARFFGSRADQWRLFKASDFPAADRQYKFGAIGAVSLKSRLGLAGALMERCLYTIDLLLAKMGIGSAIVLSVYTAPKTS